MSRSDRRLEPKPVRRHAEAAKDAHPSDLELENGEPRSIFETASTILDHVETMIEMAKEAGLSAECIRLLTKAKQQAEDVIAEETGSAPAGKRPRTH